MTYKMVPECPECGTLLEHTDHNEYTCPYCGRIVETDE